MYPMSGFPIKGGMTSPKKSDRADPGTYVFMVFWDTQTLNEFPPAVAVNSLDSQEVVGSEEEMHKKAEVSPQLLEKLQSRVKFHDIFPVKG